MSEMNTNGDSNLTCDNDLSYFTAMSLDTRAYDYYVNGNGCSAVTYQGSLGTDGEIVYNESAAITNLSYHSVRTGTVYYFKTVITNSAAFDTNTSLFVDIQYNSKLINRCFIGVSSPIKEHMSYPYDSLSGGIYKTRWIPVVSQYEVSASDTSEIEWYLIFTGNGNFGITNIVLTNN